MSLYHQRFKLFKSIVNEPILHKPSAKSIYKDVLLFMMNIVYIVFKSK